MLRAEMADDARYVLDAAARLAVSWNHHWVGTEHVLVACLEAEREGLAPATLTAAGLSYEAVEAAVKDAVAPTAEREVPWGGAVYTPRLQKILGIAEGWALSESWPTKATIRFSTMVFALLVEGDGVAAQVVAQQGLDVDAAVVELGWKLKRS